MTSIRHGVFSSWTMNFSKHGPWHLLIDFGFFDLGSWGKMTFFCKLFQEYFRFNTISSGAKTRRFVKSSESRRFFGIAGVESRFGFRLAPLQEFFGNKTCGISQPPWLVKNCESPMVSHFPAYHVVNGEKL